MAYFDLFPRTPYDINNGRISEYQGVTNIFFRVRVIREVLQNITAYYEHTISDGDTPEILAEKVYRDAEAYWVILLANEIVDPQYEWPLDSRSFRKYIVNKYGSISNAKTTYHHYEKVITREESFTGIVTETRFIVNESDVSVSQNNVPSWYESYDSLPETQSVETIDMGGGRTVIQITKRNRVSNFDWELSQNEKRRLIKVIKPEYYPQIVEEFRALTNDSRPSFFRRLT
jgi:hypothetical protein